MSGAVSVAVGLVRRRDLVRFLAASDLKAARRSRALGMLWWLLDPLLMTGVYVFVVRTVLGRGDATYPYFVAVALIAWKWFAVAARQSIRSVAANGRTVKQILFPRAVLPASCVLSNMVLFGMGLAVLVAVLAAAGHGPPLRLAALASLAAVVAVELLLTLGVALLLSAGGVFFRDLENAVAFCLRVAFYLSPAIYAVEHVPEPYRRLLAVNPFTHLLEAYRRILLEGALPDPRGLAVALAVALVTLASGLAVFARLEPRFAKEV